MTLERGSWRRQIAACGGGRGLLRVGVSGNVSRGSFCRIVDRGSRCGDDRSRLAEAVDCGLRRRRWLAEEADRGLQTLMRIVATAV